MGAVRTSDHFDLAVRLGLFPADSNLCSGLLCITFPWRGYQGRAELGPGQASQVPLLAGNSEPLLLRSRFLEVACKLNEPEHSKRNPSKATQF